MHEIRTGVKVLIPGTIVEVVGLGTGTVIIVTAGGNRIVEYKSDLQLAEPRERSADLAEPREGSVEARIERLARVMAQADGVNPDEKATLYHPLAKAQGFLLGDAFFPAWRLYAEYARAVIGKGLA